MCGVLRRNPRDVRGHGALHPTNGDLMFLIFAIIACCYGAPGWAVFWIIMHFLFKDDDK